VKAKPACQLTRDVRPVLVQRKKPDEVWRLSYGGGELLAFTFADFSGGFQL
jgi:hypothetical protein